MPRSVNIASLCLSIPRQYPNSAWEWGGGGGGGVCLIGA